MTPFLFLVLAVMCVQLATSFAPQIRMKSVNVIVRKSFVPFTAVYCASGPPDLQSNDEEPQVIHLILWQALAMIWLENIYMIVLRWKSVLLDQIIFTWKKYSFFNRVVNLVEQWEIKWKENFRTMELILTTRLALSSAILFWSSQQLLAYLFFWAAKDTSFKIKIILYWRPQSLCCCDLSYCTELSTSIKNWHRWQHDALKGCVAYRSRSLCSPDFCSYQNPSYVIVMSFFLGGGIVHSSSFPFYHVESDHLTIVKYSTIC